MVDVYDLFEEIVVELYVMFCYIYYFRFLLVVLEFEVSFVCVFGDCMNFVVVDGFVVVEDDGFDVFFFGVFGNGFIDCFGCGDVFSVVFGIGVDCGFL